MGLSDIENIPDSGAVFTIGRSRFADNIASHFFIRKDPVVNITCGDEHSAVICQTGRLFVFGSNDWGQLGLGHKNHVSKPSCVKILKPEKVTHVACGRAHTLICTGAQKIFACGSDQEGQLGRGSSAIGDSSSSPVLVYDCGLGGPRIVEIAAGSHHSMALTSNGEVIAWGSNLEGQLGLSGISGLVNKPTKVPIPEPVKQISAGYYHSAFLTESGLLYVCGESESGKLGIDVNFSTQVAPKQMQLASPAVHVACGGHHTFILAENGDLYCTGSNASGQLGMGPSVTEIQTPKLLPKGALEGETVAKVTCGESHTAVVTESGKLFTFGDGRHGKLGLEENENNVHELTYATKYQELFILNVACGGCHTILVGQRAETHNENREDADSKQIDHQIQKKNPLPPLKLPVNRLQSETNADATETEKSHLDKENSNTAEAMTNSVPENNTENTVDNATNDESTKQSISVEKLDAPKTLSEYMSSDNTAESDKVEDSEKKIVENGNDEVENNNTNEHVGKVDAENNVESEIKEEEAEEKRPLTAEKKEEEVQKKPSEHEDTKEEATHETPGSAHSRTSLDSVPPPKPPRQKSGSAVNSSTEGTGSPSKTATTHENTTADSNGVKASEETREEQTSPARHSTTSRKSAMSKAGTEETIEADLQHATDVANESKTVLEEKVNSQNAPDDADVVHSPPPRTGKISKLFKNRRHQEIENGTKKNSNSNTKSKSKACILL